MTKADDAVACFDRGFNCAQAVLYVFCEEYGMSKEEALKVSCAFGGGMGRTGCTCGAVAGACMAIGLKYGMYRPGDQTAKEITYMYAGEFARRFKELNGSLMCTELLGCDLGTPEGMKAMKERNLHQTKCAKYVRDAAEIVRGILNHA